MWESRDIIIIIIIITSNLWDKILHLNKRKEKEKKRLDSTFIHCPRWAVAFLQKRSYNWRPRKWLGLDVANWFFFVSKKGEKSFKITKISPFFLTFHSLGG
jgi:hypothetical protein